MINEQLIITQLDMWVNQAKKVINEGKLPSYIPLLAQADPHWFACQIQLINDQVYAHGDILRKFPLMSVIKPFVLLFLLEHLGQSTVFNYVGKLPSNLPFNSLEQLELDGNFPRNPMINSGAIALASLIPGHDDQECCQSLRTWLNQAANCHLVVDENMLKSVRSVVNERNRNIANNLAKAGYLGRAVDGALATYERVCCLAGTVDDLAKLGMLLVDQSSNINKQIVLEIMGNCGLYEMSEKFANEGGFPSKSGVSGAWLSIMPNRGTIACYSPPLDQSGNSIGALHLLKQLKLSLT